MLRQENQEFVAMMQLGEVETDFTKEINEAFKFFDKDSDGKLSKKEIVKLLKEAEISGFIRGIVARKLIEGYDASGDEYVDWDEFKAAIHEIAEENE